MSYATTGVLVVVVVLSIWAMSVKTWVVVDTNLGNGIGRFKANLGLLRGCTTYGGVEQCSAVKASGSVPSSFASASHVTLGLAITGCVFAVLGVVFSSALAHFAVDFEDANETMMHRHYHTPGEESYAAASGMLCLLTGVVTSGCAVLAAIFFSAALGKYSTGCLHSHIFAALPGNVDPAPGYAYYLIIPCLVLSLTAVILPIVLGFKPPPGGEQTPLLDSDD